MDTAHRRTSARSFALRCVAWSLGLFGLLRLSWVETHGLLPLTQLQARLGVWLCGTPALPVDATLACSGADALALCLGAILAYPVRWRSRLAGAGRQQEHRRRPWRKPRKRRLSHAGTPVDRVPSVPDHRPLFC